jgi:pyruvate kinase
MVTAPGAAEADTAWCERMLRAGMNLLRINSAHEDETAWLKVIDALRAAQQATGLACRVLMDLAGPKIRTGPIEASHDVVTWKLERDDRGRVLAPTRIPLLAQANLSEPASGPALVLSHADFAHLSAGGVLSFHDARGRRRKLHVAASGDGFVGETKHKAWIVQDTKALLHRNDKMDGGDILVHLSPAPARDPSIELAAGDLLVIAKTAAMGRAAKRGGELRVTKLPRLTCTLPEALDGVAVGHRVLIDDGKFEGVVERIAKHGDLTIRIRRAPPGGGKVRAEKGLNFPDSVLALPSLTEADRAILPFVTAHADLVGMSFVQTPEDVLDLHAELEKLGCRNIGIALKIETKAGFENLPRLLLTGMRRPPLSIMIARGDLAVEVGFERLAEVQAEILWHCEAAHVPAIWATQVLDTMARTGVPSRGEITDAASSVGAECVMLNKGPYVAEALRMLVDILGRMEGHRYKKRDILRRLHVSTFA